MAPNGSNCKCCGFTLILIYNSNSAKDDNFKVLLNGTDIGHIDNNSNACTGRIFSPNTAVTSGNIYTAAISCLSPTFEATVLLNTGLWITGINTLRVESIQNNGNGNFGVVKVVRVIQVLPAILFNAFHFVAALLDTNYNFASGVGNGNTFTFTYP